MTFQEYVKYQSPIASYRAKLFVHRFNLKGDDTYDTLIMRGGIGKRSAKDILELQRKYHKKQS